MSLPWDELKPEPAPAPVPSPPLVPVPGPIDDLIEWVEPRPPDWALNQALDDLWPAVRQKALDYAQARWAGIREGQTVDVLHPTVTAETQAGKELIIADAKSRSWRTLAQGLAFDVMAAIVAAVALLSGADPFVRETWIAFGVLLLKSVVSAVISYFMRLKIQPTIKTPGQKMAVMPLPTRIDEEKTS
jgi:hypothetical protein